MRNHVGIVSLQDPQLTAPLAVSLSASPGPQTPDCVFVLSRRTCARCSLPQADPKLRSPVLLLLLRRIKAGEEGGLLEQKGHIFGSNDLLI